MPNDNVDKGTSYNIRYINLYPAGYEFSLEQQQVDLNQVAAAQYGAAFWMCYNYFNGTANTECGWERLQSTSYDSKTIKNVVDEMTLGAGRGAGIAIFDRDFFEQKFQFYKEYGERIAGRYYLSDARSELISDTEYAWFDNQTVQYVSIDSLAEAGRLSSSILFPMASQGTTIIEGTEINNLFPGLLTRGNRWIFIDQYERDFETEFALTERQAKIINAMANNLINGIEGSRGLDFSEIETNVEMVLFYDQFVGSDELSINSMVENKIELLKPRFSSWSIKGMKITSLNQRIDDQKEDNFNVEGNETPEPDNPEEDEQFDPIDDTGGEEIAPIEETVAEEIPTTQESTSFVSRKPNSEVVAYYKKFQSCASKSTSNSQAFSRRFVPKELSADLPVGRTLKKESKDIYIIKNEFSFMAGNNQYLDALANSNLVPLKTVSYSLNYFNNEVPINFISNGLTSMSIRVDSQGVTASYEYSNKMMEVPTPEYLVEKLEQNMKNSWTRKYNPSERALE